MHESHADVTAANARQQRQRASAVSQLEEAEAVNDALAEELLRIRLDRGQAIARNHESANHSHCELNHDTVINSNKYIVNMEIDRYCARG